MLSKIVESSERPFRLRFVKATGKEAGSITEKVCYYGAPNPYPQGVGQQKLLPNPRKKRKSYLESNSIPLTEFGTSQMVTPFISHILYFDGKQVIH